MSRTTGHFANARAGVLAEAIILQSIEDLWDPLCKRESLKFFEGEGFVFCSELAGLSYVKQLAIFRMLANAGKKNVYAT